MRVVQPVRKVAPFAALVELSGRRPTPQERRTWVLQDPVVFTDRHEPHTIDAGFLTDFASVPWFVTWFIDPLDYAWIDAAVIHDAGYAYLAPNRRTADRWWRDTARSKGASRFAAWTSWAVLRVAGIGSWWGNRRRLADDGPRWRMLGE